jgi:hypothetical protein
VGVFAGARQADGEGMDAVGGTSSFTHIIKQVLFEQKSPDSRSNKHETLAKAAVPSSSPRTASRTHHSRGHAGLYTALRGQALQSNVMCTYRTSA